jgi:cell division protein FtsB
MVPKTPLTSVVSRKSSAARHPLCAILQAITMGAPHDQVRELKQLQEENARLKRLVADLTLDKTMLQDVLSKKF